MSTGDKSILIITNSTDESVDSVISILAERKEMFFRFDTDFFPMKIFLKTEINGLSISGFIKKEDEVVRLEDIKSVWYRRPTKPVLPDNFHSGYVNFIQDESMTMLWSLWTSLDALFVNPPLFGSKLLEHNKLHQLKTAKKIGISVPDTIITNDPDELIYFSESHGGCIAIKLLKSNVFVKEGEVENLFVFTNLVTTEEIRKKRTSIAISPIFAQEYIKKKLELRITVVGKKIFSCAIHSQNSEKTKHDWRRYDFNNVKHEPYLLPKEAEEKILILMKEWNLNFGAIDMIITPEDKYVFLEINPNGQFGWIEEITKMPISEALADLLAK
ncbi:MAG: hypothetical protein PHZ25_03390 [Candidatus Pacebacteria bacterium]|nr:hypothetical protein [Candidatus Paceibacterota bacterium]